MANIRVSASRVFSVIQTNLPVNVRVSAVQPFAIIRPPSIARILVYTANTADSSVLAYASLLRKGGFSVYLRDDSNLTSDSVELVRSYDAVFGLRLEETSNLGDELRTAAEDAGRPYALWGFDGTFSGTGLQPGPYDAKLTGTWEGASNGTGYIDITDADHEITESFGTGLLQVQTGTNYMWALDVGQSHVGDALAEADDASSSFDTGQPTLIAIESGTDDLTLTPIATTERSLVLGFPWNNTAVTDDGEEIVWRSFTWLLNDKPLAPAIFVVDLQPTAVTLGSEGFNHLNPVRTHAATRWQITLQTDTTWSSPVYDSSYVVDLLEHTTPDGTLDPDEDYMARALHRDDFGIDSGWGPALDLTTADYGTGGAAGYMIEFFNSSDTLISSIEKVTESTTYEELLEEAIAIPENTAYIEISPIKRGASSGGAAVKELNLDLGYISRGYAPHPYRPEVHTDELIHAAFVESAASGTDVDVDWSLGRHQNKELTSSPTLTFSNMELGEHWLRLEQGSGGSFTVTWPGAVQFIGSSTLSTTAGYYDMVRLLKFNDTTIYAWLDTNVGGS